MHRTLLVVLKTNERLLADVYGPDEGLDPSEFEVFEIYNTAKSYRSDNADEILRNHPMCTELTEGRLTKEQCDLIDRVETIPSPEWRDSMLGFDLKFGTEIHNLWFIWELFPELRNLLDPVAVVLAELLGLNREVGEGIMSRCDTLKYAIEELQHLQQFFEEVPEDFKVVARGQE